MTLFVMVKKEHLEGYPLASEEKLDKLAPNDTLVEHAEDKRNKGRNTSPRELFSGMDDYLRVSLLPIERSRTCSYEKESFAWDQCDKKYATIRKLNLHKTAHSSRSLPIRMLRVSSQMVGCKERSKTILFSVLINQQITQI